MAFLQSLLSRSEWARVCAFSRTYGWERTLVKVAGRLRGPGVVRWLLGREAAGERSVSFAGCGQHAFSALCFFLRQSRGNVFLEAFDAIPKQAETLASFYGFRQVVPSFDALLENPSLRTVYIASNHASHTPYGIEALRRGLAVYVEKPLSISWEQWRQLQQAIQESSGRIFCGYNRPYAGAIVELTAALAGRLEPLKLRCTVRGHVLGPGHWYRRPEEGTRICGNGGHWIDLWVHCVHKRCLALPRKVDVVYEPEDWGDADDNYRLGLSSAQGDRLMLEFTSREELLEGVHEVIECQCGYLRAEIDDF